MTKDNKQQKLSDSTDTAIAYSTCYAQPFFTRIWEMPNKNTGQHNDTLCTVERKAQTLF